MTSAFGAKWTSTHGDDFAATSGRVWAIDLAGMDARQIQRGLKITCRQEWPPTLSEFRAACLGVIPIEAVELQRRGEPGDQHPFTVLVGRFLREHEWRMADPQRQERMLANAYALAREHVMGGGALPAYTAAAQQLTAEDERPPPPPIMLTAEQAIQRIRDMLRIAPTGEALPEPPHRVAPVAAPCARCKGTRVDPNPSAYHPAQQTPGECLACYGSGIEAAYNRTVHEDGTTEEKL